MAVGFFLFSLWKAKLISYLAKRSVVLPFDGVESLMLSSNYKILVAPGTVAEDTFKTTDIPLWQKAWTERILPNIEFYTDYLESI